MSANEESFIKYQRTLHLPNSLSVQNDDKVINKNAISPKKLKKLKLSRFNLFSMKFPLTN
jgi:hypothetical protein